jgi:hypothetical protein
VRGKAGGGAASALEKNPEKAISHRHSLVQNREKRTMVELLRESMMIRLSVAIDFGGILKNPPTANGDEYGRRARRKGRAGWRTVGDLRDA